MSRFARTLKFNRRTLTTERRSRQRAQTIWRVELGYYIGGVRAEHYASASIFEGSRREIVARIVRFFNIDMNPALRNISASIKDMEQCNYPAPGRRICHRGVAKNGADDAIVSICVVEHEGICYRRRKEDDKEYGFGSVDLIPDYFDPKDDDDDCYYVKGVSGPIRVCPLSPENERSDSLEERVELPHLQTA